MLAVYPFATSSVNKYNHFLTQIARILIIRTMCFTVFFFCMSPTCSARGNLPEACFCGCFVCQWMRTNRYYYNNPEDVSRSIKPYLLHMFINMNLANCAPFVLCSIRRFWLNVKLTKTIFKKFKMISVSSWCGWFFARGAYSLIVSQSMLHIPSLRLFA